MKKKLLVLSLCSVLLCILFLFSPAFAIDFAGGSGSPEDPFLIATQEQLNDIRKDLSQSYALCSNIILTGEWTPIGDENAPFTGNFDGRGYEISGLNVNITGDESSNSFIFGYSAGLFGYVSGSSISGVTVSGSVSLKLSGQVEGHAGGIVGFMEDGSITDCRNLCSVTVETQSTTDAGGIAGVFYGTELGRCCNQGNIYGKGIAAQCGGIAGVVASTVEDCYNTASIEAVSFSADDPYLGQSFAGGITASGDTILRCYNTGKISSQSEVYAASGSIAGVCLALENCFFLEETADFAVYEYWGETEPDAVAVSQDALKLAETFVGFDFERVWTMEGDSRYPYPELRSVQRNVTVTGLFLSSYPAKLEYVEGEELDLSGGEITASYSDLTREKLAITDDMISGFDSIQTGEQTVTVSYGGRAVTFTVSVKAKTLLSLTLDKPPDRLVYPRNAALDPAGMTLTAHYDNGKSEDVTTLASFSGFSAASPGECTVSAQYGGKSAEFTSYVFGFNEVSLSLEGSVTMNFYAVFPGMEEADYTPCILFFRNSPTPEDISAAYGREEFSASWIEDDGKLMFSYKNIAAKDMGDDIYAVLCAQTEDGPIFSAPSSMSVARYAAAALESYSNEKLQRLMVDMLRYGAAAQQYFNYNTDLLATSYLTPDQLALGTSTAPTLNSITALYDDALTGEDVSLFSASLSLDNTISMNIYAGVQNGCSSPKLLTFDSYASGGDYSVNTASSISDMVTSEGSYAGFIPNIAPRYFRTPYYARVYAPTDSGDGYSKLLRYSVESYAASVVKGSQPQSFKDLMNAMMNYGDAAAAYFGG